MKLEVKKLLEKYFDIKNEKLLNKILWTIKGRQDCYGEVGLSRCENTKFNTTQRQLRDIIDVLKSNKLLILKERRKGNNNWLCNVYEVSDPLYQILQLLQTYIEFLNDKIIKWSKENFESKLKNYGIKNFNGKLFDKKSKITYNKKTFIITEWKLNKHYNLFNFIKKYFGLNTKEMIKVLFN